jgi:hypothetical protein
MPTLTTMVRAGVAIRGGVTWPSVYTYQTWLPSGQSSPVCWECPPPGNSIAGGRLPGNAQGWFHPGWADENDLRLQYNTRMAEPDRIAEFKEFAVFFRRFEKAAG